MRARLSASVEVASLLGAGSEGICVVSVTFVLYVFVDLDTELQLPVAAEGGRRHCWRRFGCDLDVK